MKEKSLEEIMPVVACWIVKQDIWYLSFFLAKIYLFPVAEQISLFHLKVPSLTSNMNIASVSVTINFWAALEEYVFKPVFTNFE